MNMQSFLNDLIKTGREYAEMGQQKAEEQLKNNKSSLDELMKTGREYAEVGQRKVEKHLKIRPDDKGREARIEGMKTGAVTAGALLLLLGTEAGRKLSSAALKVGALAAVGGLAWNAWQNLQEKQSGTNSSATAEPPVVSLPIDKLTGDEAEERSRILIKAMIIAAKADGKMDKSEVTNINKQIQKLGLGDEIVDVLQAGIVTPLSAEAVANMSTNQTIASEIYVVSMIVTDPYNPEESRYMDTLAKALELPSDLVRELEGYRDES